MVHVALDFFLGRQPVRVSQEHFLNPCAVRRFVQGTEFVYGTRSTCAILWITIAVYLGVVAVVRLLCYASAISFHS